MDNEHHDASQDTPSFVPDEAASAGSEKPAVARDDAREDASQPEDEQSVAPQDFDVADAITETSIDRAGDDD